MQRAEHAEKNFLGKVEGFFAIAEQMGGEPEDQAVMLEDERGVGGFVAGKAALDERRFSRGDL